MAVKCFNVIKSSMLWKYSHSLESDVLKRCLLQSYTVWGRSSLRPWQQSPCFWISITTFVITPTTMCRKMWDQKDGRKENCVEWHLRANSIKVLLVPRGHCPSPRPGREAWSAAARRQPSLAPHSGNINHWIACRIISSLCKQRLANYSPNLASHLCLYGPWAENCFYIFK